MKICMLAPEFIPVWGGVGTFIVDLVRHLPRNYEVHIVAPERMGFNGEKVSTSQLDISQYFGSNVHIHFISKANDTFFYNASFQYACSRFVPKLLLDEKIDLIHSHTAHMPDLLLMLREHNKPIITTVHTTIKSQRLGTQLSKQNFFEIDRSEKTTLAMYPILRSTEMVYFMRKRIYVTPSQWMKKYLGNYYNITEDIKVIPNSVDMADYRYQKYDGKAKELIQNEFSSKKIILYAGRLLAMKGVDVLIEAIPEILKYYSENVLFVFAGPGDKDYYINKTKSMQILNHCLFTGSLPKEQIIHLMKASSIVVLPSFLENIPYTILESMACGVPVVANNVGGIPEVIKDGYNGKLVQPGSRKMLAQAILNLLQDESLRESMGKNARNTISEKFSWDVNVGKYCKLYEGDYNLEP